jgi:hypothetical protein
MSVNEQDVLNALKAIQDPDLGKDIVSPPPPAPSKNVSAATRNNT